MINYDFVTESMRMHLTKQNRMVFRGFFPEDNPEGRTIKVYVNKKEIPVEITIEKSVDVRRRYLHYQMNVGEEVTGEFGIPEEPVTEIRVYSCKGSEEAFSFRADGKLYQSICSQLESNLEMERLEEDKIVLTGWSAAGDTTKCEVFIDKKSVPFEVQWKYRKDVVDVFGELSDSINCGYEIFVPDQGGKRLVLILKAADKQKRFEILLEKVRQGEEKQTGSGYVRKAIAYWKHYGFRKMVRKVFYKLKGKKDTMNYEEFLKKYGVDENELERQRQDVIKDGPLFSVVVPLYCTKEKFLREMIESVQAQTYTNWELCLADGSGKEKSLKETVDIYAKEDKRIKYILLESNEGIAGNTNEALKMANGDFIVLTDHDDLLSPEALYQCAKAIQKEPQTDVIYSDEDKVDMNGRHYFEPHFKSDFNIDLLCTMNYICHLFVFHKTILEKAGFFQSEYDGAQDHDFILRCTEAAEHIAHIPRVLYHWRCHSQSTSENPESKLYAFTNGCKAVKAHYDRIGIPAEVERGPFYGMYHTRYQWKEEPLLSIIIPNKDHVADLRKCMDSIEEKSTYRNFEFIIVENNSTEEETFAYYKEIETRDNVTVLYYKGDFNYSKINNFGVAQAKGEYILLLNNDTEMIEPDSIKEMLDVCMRPDVGIAGAKLLYEDNTIQHAGVIVGFGGIAGHAFIGQDKEDNGYFSRSISVQDLSAVTAACLMVRKSVYEEVGGLDEEYKVAFNDIDFCLKVRKAGYLVVYNPYAQFYHYESKSRGLEDSADKVARFQREIALFGERWGDILEKGDPYYNPNLTLDKADFSLKE